MELSAATESLVENIINHPFNTNDTFSNTTTISEISNIQAIDVHLNVTNTTKLRSLDKIHCFLKVKTFFFFSVNRFHEAQNTSYRMLATTTGFLNDEHFLSIFCVVLVAI